MYLKNPEIFILKIRATHTLAEREIIVRDFNDPEHQTLMLTTFWKTINVDFAEVDKTDFKEKKSRFDINRIQTAEWKTVDDHNPL